MTDQAGAFDPTRVAEVIVSHPDGERRGTGYLTGAQTVLTAAHVVEDATTVKVRFNADQASRWEAPARTTWAKDGVDVAVLSLYRDDPQPVSPVRYGRLSDRALPVQVDVCAGGFPAFTARKDADKRDFRDFFLVFGFTDGSSGRRGRTYFLNVSTPPGKPEDHAPWSGMSGAALWAEGRYLIGVIVTNYGDSGVQLLDALRLDDLMEKKDEAGTTLRDALGTGADLAEVSASGLARDARPSDAAPPVLDAYRIRTATARRGRWEVDELFRARLDVRWCLRRGRHVTVLADASGDDWLTDELNTVERSVEHATGTPPRRWWTMRPAGRLPPRREADLEAFTDDPQRWAYRVPETSTGLIVEWDERQEPAAAAGFAAAFRQLLPQAPVVFRVSRRRWDLTLTDAAAVAEVLREQELMVRARLHGPAASGGTRAAVAGSACQALIGWLRDEDATGPWLAPLPDADGLPAAVPPARIARQVVTELNKDDPWPGAEQEVLAEVRMRLPQLYPALLTEHAARRDHPARLLSLEVATRTDPEIDHWIRGARTRLPLPGRDLPSRSIGRELGDAMTLGLLRAALPEEARAWSPHAGPAVRRLCDHVGDPQGALRDASAQEATAADRAGLTASFDLALLEHATVRPAGWALLARRGLTKDALGWLAELRPPQRRLIGLDPGAGPSATETTTNAALADALWPSLPGD